MMNTYTGKIFDPMNITEDDIVLEDIAHALSLLCRGGGHLKSFYSVGQHSINCMKEAAARDYSPDVQLACLLHDASEAYISDIVRPVKIYLNNYIEIEERIMDVIFKHFYITHIDHKLWKQVDDDILSYELKYLMPGEEKRIPETIYSRPDLNEYHYTVIEEQFIQYANKLMNQI